MMLPADRIVKLSADPFARGQDSGREEKMGQAAKEFCSGTRRDGLKGLTLGALTAGTATTGVLSNVSAQALDRCSPPQGAALPMFSRPPAAILCSPSQACSLSRRS